MTFKNRRVDDKCKFRKEPNVAQCVKGSNLNKFLVKVGICPTSLCGDVPIKIPKIGPLVTQKWPFLDIFQIAILVFIMDSEANGRLQDQG